MSLARVVSFEGVNKARIDDLRRRITEGERPEELPASEIVVLHDPETETSLSILFFENEEDYRKGDAVQNAMPSSETPGGRTAVRKYEVAIRMADQPATR